MEELSKVIEHKDNMMNLAFNSSSETFDGINTFATIKNLFEKLQKSPHFKELDALEEPNK